MSGGKLVFGAALGYRDVEYKAFNIKKGALALKDLSKT